MNHIEIPTSIPPADERITIVLKAQEGSTLNQIRQFVSLGMPVAIGRGIAVIAGACEGDVTPDGLEPDLVAIIAELQQRLDLVDKDRVSQSAQDGENVNQTTRIPVLNGARSLIESLVASGEMGVNEARQLLAELDDLPPFNIDDHVKLVAEARRYRWLRDVAATTGSGHTPMVKVAGGPGRWRVGEDLDQSIDQAMKAWPINEQDQEESAGPAEIGRPGKDVQVVQADVDPRDLFIAANPVSVAPGDLEKGCSGFVDHRTHADYLIFLAGYQAAQGVGS